MKGSETDFRFPVFAFAQSGEQGGYSDSFTLRWSYRKVDFEDGLYTDMELIDSDCRRWMVRDAYMICTPTQRRWWHIGPIKPHVWKSLDLEVDEIDGVSFAVLLDRVCSIVTQENQDPESAEWLQEFLGELRAAKNAEELFYAANLDAAPGFGD